MAERKATGWIANLVLTAALVAAWSPAVAQPAACGVRADIVARLAEKYGEQPWGVGLTESGTAVELLASEDGSTWTIMVTTPDGRSCLVATGEQWQRTGSPKPTGRGA